MTAAAAADGWRPRRRDPARSCSWDDGGGNDDDGNDDALGLRAPRPPRTLRTSNFCVLPPFAADMGYCMPRRGVRACV
jgi:hypothetical protein